MIQATKEEEWAGDVTAITSRDSFWMSPEGRLYDVNEWGHYPWARKHETTSEEMYALDWLKISCSLTHSRDDRVTQAQLDVLFSIPPDSLDRDPKDIEVR